jgi:hypothetical protein
LISPIPSHPCCSLEWRISGMCQRVLQLMIVLVAWSYRRHEAADQRTRAPQDMRRGHTMDSKQFDLVTRQ